MHPVSHPHTFLPLLTPSSPWNILLTDAFTSCLHPSTRYRAYSKSSSAVTSPRSMPRSWQFLKGKLSYWLLHLSGSRKNQLRAAGSTSRSGLPHIDLSPLNLLWIKKRHLRGIRKATSRWRPPRTSSLVLQSLGGRSISISRGPPQYRRRGHHSMSITQRASGRRGPQLAIYNPPSAQPDSQNICATSDKGLSQ